VDFLRVAPAVVCRAGDVPWLSPLAGPWPDHWVCDRAQMETATCGVSA